MRRARPCLCNRDAVQFLHLVHLNVDIAMTEVPLFLIGWPQRLHWKVRSTFRNRAESVIALLHSRHLDCKAMYGFGPSSGSPPWNKGSRRQVFSTGAYLPVHRGACWAPCQLRCAGLLLTIFSASPSGLVVSGGLPSGGSDRRGDDAGDGSTQKLATWRRRRRLIAMFKPEEPSPPSRPSA